MFKVLKVDGPHIITDKGMVTISSSQYADGGKTQPVSPETWLEMRDAFVAMPEIKAAMVKVYYEPTVEAALRDLIAVVEKLGWDK